jgi:hypothetical protein
VLSIARGCKFAVCSNGKFLLSSSIPSTIHTHMKGVVKSILARLGLEVSKVPTANLNASNFDEYSVIKRWTSELAISSRYCVDIGASDGLTMSNSYALFKAGWSGLAVEFRGVQFASLSRVLRDCANVTLARSCVSPYNVASLLDSAGAPRNFGFLTIDIDGYDYFVLEALLKRFRPSLICTEVNLHFPPPIKFTLLYDPAHDWNGGSFYGQSICQLHKLCINAEYSIVELHYNNAFIVPNELCRSRGLEPALAYQRGFLDKADRSEKLPWHADIDSVLGQKPHEALSRLRNELKDHEGRFEISI